MDLCDPAHCYSLKFNSCGGVKWAGPQFCCQAWSIVVPAGVPWTHIYYSTTQGILYIRRIKSSFTRGNTFIKSPPQGRRWMHYKDAIDLTVAIAPEVSYSKLFEVDSRFLGVATLSTCFPTIPALSWLSCTATAHYPIPLQYEGTCLFNYNKEWVLRSLRLHNI